MYSIIYIMKNTQEYSFFNLQNSLSTFSFMVSEHGQSSHSFYFSVLPFSADIVTTYQSLQSQPFLFCLFRHSYCISFIAIIASAFQSLYSLISTSFLPSFLHEKPLFLVLPHCFIMNTNPNSTPMILLSNITNLVSVKLDNNNYMQWKFQITSTLKDYKLLDVVDGSYTCPKMYT